MRPIFYYNDGFKLNIYSICNFILANLFRFSLTVFFDKIRVVTGQCHQLKEKNLKANFEFLEFKVRFLYYKPLNKKKYIIYKNG